jgi:hypothetical protein
MSQASYGLSLRGATRGLWSGATTGTQFSNSIRASVRRGLINAAEEGAKECGVQFSEFTDDELRDLEQYINTDLSFLPGLRERIQEKSKKNKGNLGPLIDWVDGVWVNRYSEVRNKFLALACGDQKARWEINPAKESCSSCLSLNGKVKRFSFWNKTGILPARKYASYLKCGGHRCGCMLIPTKEPLSKGPLPSLP